MTILLTVLPLNYFMDPPQPHYKLCSTAPHQLRLTRKLNIHLIKGAEPEFFFCLGLHVHMFIFLTAKIRVSIMCFAYVNFIYFFYLSQSYKNNYCYNDHLNRSIINIYFYLLESLKMISVCIMSASHSLACTGHIGAYFLTFVSDLYFPQPSWS